MLCCQEMCFIPGWDSNRAPLVNEASVPSASRRGFCLSGRRNVKYSTRVCGQSRSWDDVAVGGRTDGRSEDANPHTNVQAAVSPIPRGFIYEGPTSIIKKSLLFAHDVKTF